MQNHALEVELKQPILMCGESTENIVLLKVNCTEEESALFASNVSKQVDTNSGVYSVSVSDKSGNPLNPQSVMLDLENIKAEIGRASCRERV